MAISLKITKAETEKLFDQKSIARYSELTTN